MPSHMAVSPPQKPNSAPAVALTTLEGTGSSTSTTSIATMVVYAASRCCPTMSRAASSAASMPAPNATNGTSRRVSRTSAASSQRPQEGASTCPNTDSPPFPFNNITVYCMQFLVKRERMVRKIGLVLAGALTIGLPVALLSQHTGSGLLESEAGRPWPAPVTRDASIGQTPLAPADAIRTFTMPPGFRIQLVASEPIVKDPILAEFDEDGRLWVLELHGFAVNRQMDNSFEPINELVVIEDTNEDGVYDKRTVFMDALVMPRAFKVLANRCALVGEPPNLWQACDTDGDLVADSKTLVSDRFATRGVVEHGANGLYWAIDNTITIAQNDWDLTL